MLLRTAKSEPPYSARNRIDSLLGSASGLYEAAETDAAAESWDDAIYKMQEAVGHAEQAVKASGFTY